MTQAIQNMGITHDLTIAPNAEQLELHLDNLNDTVVENYIEEIEDDLADFGGNHPIVGNDLDLRNDSIWRLYVVRVFWLIIMVLFGMVTSTIIADKAALLEEIVILAAFLPAIVDMGGNAGAQTATLVLRGMAIGQFQMRWKDFFFVLKRELPVALLLAGTVAILEGAMALFVKNPGTGVLMVVAAGMFCCTLMGSLIGAMLPFAAKKVGADPATLSSPLITSICDLVGVIIYFALAIAFLSDMIPG